MVSHRPPGAEKKTAPNRALADAAPPAAPMKVTFDEVALRTLYARMLKSRLSKDGARNGSEARSEAMIATTIDLREGDALSKADDEPLIPSAATGSLHLLPAHLGLAAGVALAYKLQGEPHVVLSLARASALTFGSSHEALTYASSQKLPLIVVVRCESGADPATLEAKAAAYGIPSISVDASDAVAIYRVSREAIDRARAGRGPTLIHGLTFEPAADPIEHLERYLDKHGWWSPAWKRELSRT